MGGVVRICGLDEFDREAGVEGDKRSREGVDRRRGLIMLSLADCCRFSLEADARSPVMGTGSREGRGIPDGLELGEWSMFVVMLAIVDSKSDVAVGHAEHAKKRKRRVGYSYGGAG